MKYRQNTTLGCFPHQIPILSLFPHLSAMLSSWADSNSGHPVSNQRELDCRDRGPNLCDRSRVTRRTVEVSHPSKPVPSGMRLLWHQLHGGLKSD